MRAHKIKTFASAINIDLNSLPDYNGEKSRFAEKNFMSIANQFQENQLLLLSTKAIGASRRYYGFIPLTSPKAYCALEGQLIDLHTNAILWRYTAIIKIDINGSWDQPPNYPNFSNELNNAVIAAKNDLLRDFFATTNS